MPFGPFRVKGPESKTFCNLLLGWKRPRSSLSSFDQNMYFFFVGGELSFLGREGQFSAVAFFGAPLRQRHQLALGT